MIDLRSQTIKQTPFVPREATLLATHQRAMRTMRALFICDILAVTALVLVAFATVVCLVLMFTNSLFHRELYRYWGHRADRPIVAVGAFLAGIFLQIRKAVITPRFEKARSELVLAEAQLEAYYHYTFEA